MLCKTRIDAREFYEVTRQSLEKAADAECEHIERLFRSISALRRLIEQGQATIDIPTGCWGAIASTIEEEADRIDNFRRARRINKSYHARPHDKSPSEQAVSSFKYS